MMWVKNRLKERSTWLAITCLCMLAGWEMNPEAKEAFIQAGLAIGAFIFAVTKDAQR